MDPRALQLDPEDLALAEIVIECVDVTFQPSSPRYVHCTRPACCFNQFLGFELPVRSRTQTVPLLRVPHSAPLPTTLTQPLPLAWKPEQLVVQLLGEQDGARRGQSGGQCGQDRDEEGELFHAICIGLARAASS